MNKALAILKSELALNPVAVMSYELSKPGVSAVAVTGQGKSVNQTITLLGKKYDDGRVDLMSEREGSTWRRSITIEANNLDALITALTKMSKHIKGKAPVGVAVIRNGKIE